MSQLDMQHVILGALFIELLEFWSLVAMRHIECVIPSGVGLGVDVSLARISPKLFLDCMYNQVLNVFDGRHAWRPTIDSSEILMINKTQITKWGPNLNFFEHGRLNMINKYRY